MKARLQAWLDRIDGLGLRERLLGFCTVLAVLCVIWSELLMRPLDASRDALDARVESLTRDILTLNKQVQALAEQRRIDPDAVNRERLLALRREASTLAGVLERLTGDLVPPGQMARLLEVVLTRDTTLTLVKLEGLGALPVLGGDTPAEPSTGRATVVGEPPPSVLYRHGLRIEFEGSYLETLRYLTALEGLDWRFLWDSVELDVEEYPRAKVAITVYSLSLARAWIGV